MDILLAIYLVVSSMWAAAAPRETVRLISPPNNAKSSLRVTFKWAIRNARPGVAYCSEVLTDKGRNPFDGDFEDRFDAGSASELSVELPHPTYSGQEFEWGVRVKVCNGRRNFRSQIRTLIIDGAADDSPASLPPMTPAPEPVSPRSTLPVRPTPSPTPVRMFRRLPRPTPSPSPTVTPP